MTALASDDMEIDKRSDWDDSADDEINGDEDDENINDDANDVVTSMEAESITNNPKQEYSYWWA